MKRTIDNVTLAFQKIIEYSNIGIVLIDSQLTVVYKNPSASIILGQAKELYLGNTLSTLIHPEDVCILNDLVQRVLLGAYATESATVRFLHPNEEYVWVQCSFTNMLEEPEVKAILCNFVDISKQKFNELQLLKQTDQIAELLETMTDAFIALDENLCYTYVNGQALKLTQKNREDLIGRHIWEVFPDAVGSATYQAIQTALVDRKYVTNTDFYTPLLLWQENRVYPSADGVSVFIRNITKQKKEEQHLKLLESVVTNTTDSVMITDAEPFDLPGPRIVYVNEAFTQMTGYTAEEVVGKTPRILQGPKTDKEKLKLLGTRMRNWQVCEVSLINYKKDGEEFWVNFTLNPVADENGWFTHWVAIERDITEQKIEELQKAFLAEVSELFNEPLEFNSLLQKLMQNVVNYDHFIAAEIWLIGADKNKMTMFAKASRTKEMAEFYKETNQFQNLKKGESLPGAVWELGKILEWNNLDSRPGFYRGDTAKVTGLKIAYGVPIMSENEIIGVLVVGLGKKRPEKSKSLIPLFKKLSTHFGIEIKRKQLEEELRQIFSLVPDIICVVGKDRYLKKVNPAMCTLLGYTEAELLAKTIDSFLHPDDLEASKLRMQNLAIGEKSVFFEVRFITKAGDILWLSSSAHLSPADGLLFSVARNITDKKIAEQMLYASESSLNALIESTNALIYSLDRDFNYVTYSQKLKRVMQENFNVDIYRGYSILDFLQSYYPKAVKEWEDIYKTVFSGEALQFDKEYELSGKRVIHRISIYPIWQNKEVTGLSCFINDITESSDTTSRLKNSEKRYSELFQLSPLPKLVCDLETLKILDVNNAAMKQYGYTRDEFLNISIQNLNATENKITTKKSLTTIIESTAVAPEQAIVHQKKNGEKISVYLQTNPVEYEGKKAQIVVARDVTESINYIKAIEERNKKLQEISWIQSHVVRAPLARILGLIALIEATEESLSAETQNVLQYIIDSAHELDDVIRDITLKTVTVDQKNEKDS